MASPARQTRNQVRNLAHILETGSSSRILNLWLVRKMNVANANYNDEPFFQSNQLNRAIILKHTLRHNELELFSSPRKTATKIILPFDGTDLKLGGQSIFINERGYDAFLRDYCDRQADDNARDIGVLTALDEIPSLDPFIVREHLARRGVRPAACYLKISPADISRMVSFANSEIESLVRTAFGETGQSSAMKLTSKILSDELDVELAPLRGVLRLSEKDFSDGVFCWRAFLYFKWSLIELRSKLDKVLNSILSCTLVPSRDPAINQYNEKVRPLVVKRIFAAVDQSSRTLAIYNRAYASLVHEKNPSLFKQFLLDGPSLFFELGENLGILNHMASYWTYKMNGNANNGRVSAEDFMDIMVEFEDSLPAERLE